MRELYDNKTIFFLEIDEPKDNEKMKIEFFLSHPSFYQISFNYSDYIEIEEEFEEEIEIEEELENDNYTEIEKINDELEYNLENTINYLYENNIFENSLRKLYVYPNDLIEIEQEYSNKKTYILNLNKDMIIIQLIFKKIKSSQLFITPAIYIKYQCKKDEFKSYNFQNNLTASLINGVVSVSFKGIIPEVDKPENITEDFKVEYEAFLYKKIEEENYENINHVFLPNRYISRSGTLKISDMNERIYSLTLTGIDQNGNDQLLEVVAEILFGYDREYFVYNITMVYIENRTIVYPDDDINNKTDNKTDNNNGNEIDNVDILFYIVISAFAGIIILIIIVVFYKIRKKPIDNNSYLIDSDKDENIEILNERNIIN